MPRRGPGRTSAIKARVGQRIRALREREGLSQAELARRVGTSASHLNKLEGGQRAATIPTLEAIAKALRLGVADFFADSSVEEPRRRTDRAWLNLVAELRRHTPVYLQMVQVVMRTLDREIEQAARRTER